MTTMNTYTHVLPDVSRAAAKGLDGLFTVDESGEDIGGGADGAEHEDATNSEDASKP